MNAANITSGTLSLARLPGNVITNHAKGVTLNGIFNGNGAGLTGISLVGNSAGFITPASDFILSSSPQVGTGPFSVVASDVNGDGWVDLISANYFANTLTVLTNNGSGGFLLSSSPPVGLNPNSLVAADVNGDGRADLISANANANTLSVLTNNGSGGFLLSSTPSVGLTPNSVVAADVNGDGRLDLISANYNANTLTVLTNNGGGGFLLSMSPPVGSSPRSVVAADVNGDGRVDLISANWNANTLTVLTNNGSGGFLLSSSPPAGLNPYFVVAADLNGDGWVDLVSANYIANTLTVLTNNGSGGFLLSSSPPVGTSPSSVVAVDVNGDGRADLISANYNANTLTVLANTVSGSFLLSSSPPVGFSPRSVVAADVNGDGRVDLISANGNPNTLTVLWNAVNFTGNFIGGNVSATALTVNGNAAISYNNSLEFGFGIAGKEANAGKIGYQLFSPDALDIVGAGPANRKIKFWCEAGAVFTGTITQPSDRKLKQDFEPLDGRAVLEKVAALPIQSWAYKFEHGQRHIGPVAQDFHAAFGLNGDDDEHIATVDADGVALSAIQGLNQKVEDRAVELKRKQTEITELKARLDKLEQRMNQ